MLKQEYTILACVLFIAGNMPLVELLADPAKEWPPAAKGEPKADLGPKPTQSKPAAKPEPKKPTAKPSPKPAPAAKAKASASAPKPNRQGGTPQKVADPEAAAAARAKGLIAELEVAIKAEDFKKVEAIGKTIENEGRRQSSYQRAAEWSALISRYSEAQALLLQSYLIHRLDEVAEFTERVRKACLEGKDVRELEMLQIEAIGLSVESSVFRYQGGNSGPWRARLEAAKSLLQGWIGIQNYIDQGYEERAAERIEHVARSSSDYPIIAREDLDKLVGSLKGNAEKEEIEPAKVIEGKLLGAMHDNLKGVEKPSAVVFAAVAAAIGELQAMAAEVPPYSQDVRELMRGFYGLARTREMLDTGNILQATYDLPDSDDVKEYAAGYYMNSRNALAIEILQKQFPTLSAVIEPAEGEKLESYLFRLLVSAEAKEVPETRLRLLRALVAMGYRDRKLPDHLRQIQERHEAFVKAETELRIGNVQSAVRLYRTASYDPNDTFGLAKLAESRLADIQDQSPEALVAFDQKMLLEVKALRLELGKMAKEIASLKATIEAPE